MNIFRTFLFLTTAVCSVGAAADVSITTQTQGKASFINVGGEGVSRIKGTRQRNEQTVKNKTAVSILDVDGKRFIDINDKKKAATITPLAKVAETIQKVGLGTIESSLTKTVETKTIASYPCTVYNFSITLPFSPTGANSGLDMNLLVSGTACVSNKVPGLADYQAFYKAAADSGFIFGDPRTTQSPTGAAQAKAWAEMTRKMAEAGVALESHVTITASGEGPMAAVMAKLAASDVQTTVTQISTDALTAGMFDIPADYKVKTLK